MGMNYKENTSGESAERLYRAFNKVYITGRPDKGAEYEFYGKTRSSGMLRSQPLC